MDYEYISLKILSIEEDTASVEAVQTTKKVHGPAFRNNEMTALQTLQKVDGKWYISITKIVSVKFLD